MTTIPKYLDEIYFRIRQFPRWLFNFQERWNLSPKEAERLVDLDESRLELSTAIRKGWLQNRQSHNYQRPVVDQEWARERRREYITEQLKALHNDLASIRIDMAREADEVIALLIAEREKSIISMVIKSQRMLDNLDLWKTDDIITETMRQAAFDYPLSKLLNTVGRVSCPLHEDKNPSFSVRHKGHCFSCGENLSAVDWLMHVQGLGFAEAVRELSK